LQRYEFLPHAEGAIVPARAFFLFLLPLAAAGGEEKGTAAQWRNLAETIEPSDFPVYPPTRTAAIDRYRSAEQKAHCANKGSTRLRSP
jgi:hypothetical protein